MKKLLAVLFSVLIVIVACQKVDEADETSSEEVSEEAVSEEEASEEVSEETEAESEPESEPEVEAEEPATEAESEPETKPESEPAAQIKDCGSDYNCFVSAVGDGMPAKVYKTFGVNFFGVFKNAKNFMSFTADSGLYNYYQETVDFYSTMDEGLAAILGGAGTSEEKVNMIVEYFGSMGMDTNVEEAAKLVNDFAGSSVNDVQVAVKNYYADYDQMAVGVTNSCAFTDLDAFVSVLKKWRTGSSSSSDLDFANCTGGGF